MTKSNITDLSDRIKPLLSQQAKAIMADVEGSTIKDYMHDGQRKASLCTFMQVGVPVSLQLQLLRSLDNIIKHNLHNFADLINHEVAEGRLVLGCMLPPFLAIVPMSKGALGDNFIFSFYAFTNNNIPAMIKTYPWYVGEGDPTVCRLFSINAMKKGIKCP